MVNFDFQEYGVKVKATYLHKDKCASVPGGRWNPASRTWDYLLTPVTASTMLQAFHGEISQQDQEFLHLLSSRLLMAKAVVSECKEMKVPETQITPWHHQLIAYNMVIELFGLEEKT